MNLCEMMNSTFYEIYSCSSNQFCSSKLKYIFSIMQMVAQYWTTEWWNNFYLCLKHLAQKKNQRNINMHPNFIFSNCWPNSLGKSVGNNTRESQRTKLLLDVRKICLLHYVGCPKWTGSATPSQIGVLLAAGVMWQVLQNHLFVGLNEGARPESLMTTLNLETKMSNTNL
jgi:hypothetical protein